MHVHKAYINATGKISTYALIHDLKRAIIDSKAQAGHISVLSTNATTAILLLENDESIRQELTAFMSKTFEALKDQSPGRRSGSGANKFHLMAALSGLTLTLPFHQGRLLVHPQHEVFALDYEPKPGRREFVISVLASAPPAPPAGPAPR